MRWRVWTVLRLEAHPAYGSNTRPWAPVIDLSSSSPSSNCARFRCADVQTTFALGREGEGRAVLVGSSVSDRVFGAIGAKLFHELVVETEYQQRRRPLADEQAGLPVAH